MLTQHQEPISNEPCSLVATVDTFLRSTKKPIFVLCDECYWCASYFDITRMPADSICPRCNAYSDDNNNANVDNNNGNADNSCKQLSSFPIMPNESYIFNYSSKRGVELEFKPRQ
jgi:hypothetical protein